jgi:DDE superfamily endonuclease
MIPPFKNSVGGNLTANETAFNTLLAKLRVKSEHCIRILKLWFRFLRNIWLHLASREDMQRIINYVRGTVVMHNFLRNDETSWLEVLKDMQEGEDDLDPEPTNASNAPDYSRREELLYYLSELLETTFN